MNNQQIDGCFYEQKLQKFKYQDVYLFEKIRKRKRDRVLR